MGHGRYKDGKLDFTVIANFLMSVQDWTDWERAFKKASEILYNSSEGQVQFGRIFVCDDNIGLETAEFILHPDGDPSYGFMGGFGIPGYAIHLMPYVKTHGPLTIIHELGHQLWVLGDEYCGPMFHDEIDKTNPAPNNRTIPIVDTGRVVNELVGNNALLMFGDLIERRSVISNTSTEVIVASDYPDLPTNADSNSVRYQSDAECADVANTNYCIMEKSRAAAGYFNDAGVWIPAANPVTEFCSPSNHDPDEDTMQEDLYGKSCWEVIIEKEGLSSLVLPDPAGSGPTAGWTEAQWISLEKQPRFALVLDRSGSMSTGNKMADAQHGAIYWLEYCAESSDLLTIIWYDNIIEKILDLTDVSGINIENVIQDINNLTPRGTTNIRDGLYEALNQIKSLGTRAAVQVALLLTDGKHNTPSGSSATEVIPDFNDNGVRIYSLGVGAADAVNMDVLDQISEETSGSSYSVGDDQPSIIEASMVEINAEVRGGIITTVPSTFPDSKDPEVDKVIASLIISTDKPRPSLQELLHGLNLDSVDDLLKPSANLQSRVLAIPVDVESRCERVSFSLVYPKGNDTWLYLVNPLGQAVDMFAPGIHYVISSAPHTFAIVDKPASGRWFIIALRPITGPAYTLRAIAGGENSHLRVFGNVTKSNCEKHPIRLRASAKWKHELSNLRVSAIAIGPDGREYESILSDMTTNEPNTGLYEGYLNPLVPGRYQGILRIENIGRAIIARPMQRALDHEENSLSIKVDVPRFVRKIPFYFDSGERPEVRDEEKTMKTTMLIIIAISFAVASIISFGSSALTYSLVFAVMSAISTTISISMWYKTRFFTRK